MKNKEMIEILKEYKEKYSKKGVVKFVDGESSTLFLSNLKVKDDLFKNGDSFMYTFCNTCERSYIIGNNEDNFEYGLSLGVIYDKDTLGSSGEILPTSTVISDVVAVRPVYFYAMNDNEVINNVDMLNKDYSFTYYTNFNNFVINAIESGFDYNGPESFDELKNSIMMKQGEYASLSLKTKDKKLVK